MTESCVINQQPYIRLVEPVCSMHACHNVLKIMLPATIYGIGDSNMQLEELREDSVLDFLNNSYSSEASDSFMFHILMHY